MTDVERRRRPRVGWIDRSIRSKSLVVVLFPTVVLAVALVASAAYASGGLLALDAVALAVAVVGGVTAWHYFTTGVVRRLRRLEVDTRRIDAWAGTAPVPTGRDEIGRLAARLEEAAEQVRRHAEERDRARQELTDILLASPVVSLRYDVAARRFSYASPNVEGLLGLSPEQVAADYSAVESRFHPDDVARLRQALAQGEGQRERLSLTLRCRSHAEAQEWREVEAIYSVDADDTGAPRSVSAYLVDVSARHAAQRAAEERRFMLESIFRASPDTIVVRGADQSVLLYSSTLPEAIGLDDDDAVPAGELVEEAYRYGRLGRQQRAALDELLRRCLAGERDLPPVVTTGRPGRGESGYRTYETRARPIYDVSGRVTGTVTVSRDVTDRIRLEQSLRRARAEAERASEAKSKFLSRMSHELRTPLNAILGFAQLLGLNQLPPEQKASVDQIERAGRHLLALINEVLDIARIEAGQLTVRAELVCVAEVLDEVASLLAPMAEAATVHVMVEPPAVRQRCVRADRQRLRQVLLNLGSNAVKYNEAGGTVAFTVEEAPQHRVRISVRDTGPGIPLEQQDMLFVPFSRLGAEHSGVEGTGVGLALSKQLVEVMGGTIGVDSAPGQGSTFWVELAAADHVLTAEDAGASASAEGRDRVPPQPGEVAVAGAGADGEVRTTLVVLQVEDDDSNASLVSLVLARRPQVRLLSAAQARLGLELARRHRPDLLLLDLHLPDLPGDELLHRARAMPELADTKIVVVSADATPQRIRRMLDLGVDGYLTKPLDVGALLQVIDDQLDRRAAGAR